MAKSSNLSNGIKHVKSWEVGNKISIVVVQSSLFFKTSRFNWTLLRVSKSWDNGNEKIPTYSKIILQLQSVECCSLSYNKYMKFPQKCTLVVFGVELAAY